MGEVTSICPDVEVRENKIIFVSKDSSFGMNCVFYDHILRVDQKIHREIEIPLDLDSIQVAPLQETK